MKYSCKINKGTSNNASSSESGYRDANIKVINSNQIEVKYLNHYKENLDIINISTSFFNTTVAFFLVFFTISLGFNLIFYLLVPLSLELIPPMIILSIFLIVSIVPIIVNILNAGRKIRLDLNSNDFSRVIFQSKSDKLAFLNEISIIKKTSKDTFVNASYNNLCFENVKVIPLARNKILIESSEVKEEITFYKKSHQIIWFLYIFFGIFLTLPIFLITTSLLSGTFERGMLATILFGAVGLMGMFVPSFLAKGNLYLYCDDKIVFLKFITSKARNQLEKSLKSFSRNEIAASYQYGYRIDTSKPYQILESNQKLINFVPSIILIIISSLFLVGSIVLLTTSLTSAVIMFVIFLLFFLFGTFIFKDNFHEIRKRIIRKKLIRNGAIITGEIIGCETKLFELGKKVIYQVYLKLEFTNRHNQIAQKIIKETYRENHKFCLGQKVFLCNYSDSYLLVDCEILNNRLISSQVKSDNQKIFESSNKEDLYEAKLRNNSYNHLSADRKLKSIKKPFKLLNLFALIPLLPFLAVITYIGVSVITHNPDDKDQIIFAIIFLSVFGSVFGIVFIIILIKNIRGIILKIAEKRFIRNSPATIGYISDFDRHVWYVRTNDDGGRVAKVRYLVNYKYKNNRNIIFTRSFEVVDYLFFAKSFQVGEEIAVFYDDQKEVVMKII